MTETFDQTQSNADTDFTEADDPFALFDHWFADASDSEPNDPNAMALATVGDDGMPNVRMVLMKDAGPDGFVFYTNLGSAKGGELAANAKAALCFYWKSLRRQVRVRGPVEPVSGEEADAYFASRHRSSRIGAWASRQSRPMEGRFDLEKAVALYTAKFHIGEIPRPEHWSGFRLSPVQMEFWHNRPFRLHDRIVFRRSGPDDTWSRERLFP